MLQSNDSEEYTEEGEQTTSFEHTPNPLSKKKKQYLEQAIVDRSGAYDYAKEPT